MLLAMPAWAQQTTTDDAITNYESATHQFFQGVASDWSNSHVVYSKPEAGSDTEDAVQKDRVTGCSKFAARCRPPVTRTRPT